MSTQNGSKAGGGKSLCVARKMTQPSIAMEPGGCKISGHGLALAGVGIEQDAGYWEWHVNKLPEGTKLSFGVAHKKDRTFYNELEDANKDSPEHNGRSMMKELEVKEGDTVGVAVQQSDLPMVQFLLNGEPLHEHAINRFRGLVYPSIYLPEASGEMQIQLEMNENGFKHVPPHPKFGPVILCRGLI